MNKDEKDLALEDYWKRLEENSKALKESAKRLFKPKEKDEERNTDI